MTATIRGVGSSTGSTTTISPVLPAGVVQGDLLLMFLEGRGENSAGASGWTQVAVHGFGATTAGTRLTVLRKYAAGGDATTTNTPGNHIHGAVVAIERGTYNYANPINAVATGATSATTSAVLAVSVTSTVDDALILYGVTGSLPDAAGGNQFATWVNTNLTSVTERRDATVSVGDGGALAIVSGIQASAGPTGEVSATANSVAVRAYITLAIAPLPIYTPETGVIRFDTNQHSGSYTYDALGRINASGFVATVEVIEPSGGNEINATGLLGEKNLEGFVATVTREIPATSLLGEQRLEGFAATVTREIPHTSIAGETQLGGETALVTIERSYTPETGETQLEGFEGTALQQGTTLIEPEVGYAQFEAVAADVEIVYPAPELPRDAGGGSGGQAFTRVKENNEVILAFVREFLKRAA